LVGVGELRAVLVVVGGAGPGEAASGPFAEAGDVPEEDVEAGLALDDPLGDDPADAAALVEAGHHAAGAEIIPEPGIRPEQGPEIRGEDHRPVDHPPDAGGREAVKRDDR